MFVMLSSGNLIESEIDDLAWRIQRLQLARFYGWTLADIEALSLPDLIDAIAYRAAFLKAHAATN